MCIKELKVTKFFDVKTPQGIFEKGETPENYSIGTDLYLPKLTNEFIDAFFESNKKIYPNLIKNVVGNNIFFTNSETQDFYVKISVLNKSVTIFKPIHIPTGIGFIIPREYYITVKSKSSNFNNNFTVVEGTIDMNYTYGCGIQLIPILQNKEVKLVEDQKIAQFIVQKATPVLNINFIELEQFEKQEEVIYKRNVRTGGFGSTGKF